MRYKVVDERGRVFFTTDRNPRNLLKRYGGNSVLIIGDGVRMRYERIPNSKVIRIKEGF